MHYDEMVVRQITVEAENIIPLVCDLFAEHKVSNESRTVALITMLAACFVDMDVSREKALSLVALMFMIRFDMSKSRADKT